MSNEILFYTQIATIVTFIISLFVLYRLLVQQKDATIEFLQKSLDEARQPMSDIVLRIQKERIEVAEAELERLSKDKDKLKAIQGFAKEMIRAQRDLIVALQKKIEVVENHSRNVRQAVDAYLASIPESSTEENSSINTVK